MWSPRRPGELNQYSYVSAGPTRWADPLGLVKWTCSFLIGDIEMPAGGVGLGGFAAECTSECVNQKQVVASVYAGVGGVALFSPIPGGISYSSIELYDPYSIPRKESLEGAVAYSSAGIAAAIGYSCSALSIGSAVGASCGPQLGLGLGWDSFAGAGTVLGRETKCCEK